MDAVSVILGLALVMLVIFLVARPFLPRQKAFIHTEGGRGTTLLLEREAILTTLHDLDFDYSLGKIPAEAYLAQRAQLVARGAQILSQLEALAPSPTAQSQNRADSAASLEAAIAARRKPKLFPPGSACPHCHAAVQAADKFCSACGHLLKLACTQCGHVLEKEARFCAQCGTAVTSKETHAQA